MNIQLKNIKVYEALSEETNAFHAHIYVNGKFAGYAKNDGHGGQTICQTYNSTQSNLMYEVKRYCEQLPPIKYGSIEIKQSLDIYVDNLIEKYLIEKDKRKFEAKKLKDMQKGIIYGDDTHYHILSWKGIKNIKDMFLNSWGEDLLKNKIIELKKAGHKILNTNLPKSVNP